MNKIEVKKFGEQYVACDGERSAIGKTKEDAIKGVEQMQEQNKEALENTTTPAPEKGAPLNNSKEGHPFDPFGGTSWAGKRNSFD